MTVREDVAERFEADGRYTLQFVKDQDAIKPMTYDMALEGAARVMRRAESEVDEQLIDRLERLANT